MSSSSSSSVVTFYAIPYCPFCYRIRFVLNYHGIQFEEKLVQPLGKAAPTWFLALNPLGEVPVIVHEGKPVVDSATIAQYIDTNLPAAGVPKIFPVEETAKAAHDNVVKKVAALMPLLNGFVTAMGPAVLEAKDKFNAGLIQFFTKDFNGPYILGSSPGYADVILYQILVYSDLLKAYKNWSFPAVDDSAKTAAKKSSDFFSLMSTSSAGQKSQFADHQKFLDFNERRARPGPISTFMLTHAAFRNHLKTLQSATPLASSSAEFNDSLTQLLQQFNQHAAVEDLLLFPAIDAKEHDSASKLLSVEQKDYHYQTNLLDVPRDGHHKLHQAEQQLVHALRQNQSVKELLDQLKVYGELALTHLADEEKIMSPIVNKWSWEQQANIVRYALYASDSAGNNGALVFLVHLLHHLGGAERQQIVRNVKFTLQHAETHEAKDEDKLKELLQLLKNHTNAEIQQQIQTLL